jgi:hypothetical protein
LEFRRPIPSTMPQPVERRASFRAPYGGKGGKEGVDRRD